MYDNYGMREYEWSNNCLPKFFLYDYSFIDDTSFSNLLINIYDNYEISIILISKFYSTITHPPMIYLFLIY